MLQVLVLEEFLQFHEILNVALVVQGRVVLHCLVVESNQVLGSPISHLLPHFLFELLDGEKHRVDLHCLDGLLVYFALKNHAFFLILLLDSYVVLFEVLDNHTDAIVAVLVHQYVQHPGLSVLNSAPVHRDLVVGCKTVVNFLQSCQTTPRL